MGTRIKALILCCVLPVCLLTTGCGQTKTESITITMNGEEVKTLDIMNGKELEGLQAVLSPAGYTGTVTWTSEDTGVVKITAAEGNSCSLLAKKTGSARITAQCDGAEASVWVHVQKDPDNLTLRDAALSVNGTLYAPELCNIYFAQLFYDFSETYGAYAAYYGLDLSAGLSGLKNQSCDYSSDGTWYGYFLEESTAQLAQVQALCDYAAENGITLSAGEETQLDMKVEELAQQAEEQGCDGLDAYLVTLYGTGVEQKLYRRYLRDNALAEKTYNSYADSLGYTEEELAAAYAEMGYGEGENDYPVAAMRHILIMAEPDEDGTYSEGSKAAAHGRAEEIYALWLSGERTEESFAALAEEYSGDSGSNTAGGLYEDIYDGEMVDGINDWLFRHMRTAGDTAVIDNDGSYTGTHVAYFVGYGDLYSTVLARQELVSEDTQEWFSSLMTGYDPAQGALYSEIGVW